VSILESDNNFIHLFKYWIGDTEAPERYIKWAAISMIAACLANRVYFAKRPGSADRMVPNLYILFLGEQHNYKSYSIYKAMQLLHQSNYQQYINLYEGKASGPQMYNEMQPTSRQPHRNLIYVVHDELANCLGLREYADQFLTSQTQMYYGSPFREGTRTSGIVKLEKYCMNWIAATTPQYMKSVIKPHHIDGGLFSRMITVREGYTNRKVFRVKRLDDFDQVERYLVARINGFFLMNGEFVRTPEAEAFEEKWYMAEELPTRKHDIMMKVALTLAVADGSENIIQQKHIQEAIDLVNWTAPPKDVIQHAQAQQVNPRITISDDIRMTIAATCRAKGTCQRQLITKYANRKWGVLKDDLEKILVTLEQEGQIKKIENRRGEKGGGTHYIWLDS
jgi:hypothetical protein